MRPGILRLVLKMETVLDQKAAEKGGDNWKDKLLPELCNDVEHHVFMMTEALQSCKVLQAKKHIIHACNFLMMLYDNITIGGNDESGSKSQST